MGLARKTWTPRVSPDEYILKSCQSSGRRSRKRRWTRGCLAMGDTVMGDTTRVQPAEEQDLIGSGRIAALYYRSSTLYQIREHNYSVPLYLKRQCDRTPWELDQPF